MGYSWTGKHRRIQHLDLAGDVGQIIEQAHWAQAADPIRFISTPG